MSLAMSIASTSVSMQSSKVQNSVALALTKKVMDTQEQQGAQLVEMMSAATGLGNNLDVYA